jgi:putative nucleotidyltransferase with HDIG domain
LEQSGIANEDIVDVLKHDTVLTAKLLRACNAPSLALAEPVGSVDQAVLLLGYEQILHMVLALAFGDALMVPMPGYAVEANELWRHSVMVALAGEILSQHRAGPGPEPALAFTAGLLHDIGKLAMNQVLTPECQRQVRSLVLEQGATRVEAERKVLGTDHAEVGALLLKHWRLPEEIIEGVASHHEPVLEPEGRLSPVVHLANCLAHLSGSAPGWEGYAIRINPQAAAAFELTAQKLETLIFQLCEACERAKSLLEL